MIPIQYDLFKSKEESEMDSMRLAIAEQKASNDRVRKKLFSEQGALKKEILDLKCRLEILEKNICTGVYEYNRN